MVMGDRVFDAPWMIWEVIQDFWTVTIKTSLMPFHCMLSHFCVEDNVMGLVSANWERPMVGPITEASQEKSKRLSKSDIPTFSCEFPKIQGSFRKKEDVDEGLILSSKRHNG